MPSASNQKLIDIRNQSTQGSKNSIRWTKEPTKGMNQNQDSITKWQRWALLFPTLKAVCEYRPFQPGQLDAWAAHAPSDGAIHAARFLLALWNNQQSWKCGKFDVIEAMAVWDAEHRAAFLAWAEEPWWP